MKKTILFTLLITIGLSVSAQKFAVNGYFSPSYTNRLMPIHVEGDLTYDYWKNKDSLLTPNFNYSAGLDFEYFLSENFSLSLGVNYSTYKESCQLDHSIITSSDTTGYIYNESHNASFYSIPLSLKYYLKYEKINIYIHVFGEYQYLNTHTVDQTYDYFDTSASYLSSFNYFEDGLPDPKERYNIVIGGGIGVTYNITDHVRFLFEPNFKWSLLHYMRTKDLVQVYSPSHIYSIGGKIGLSYCF